MEPMTMANKKLTIIDILHDERDTARAEVARLSAEVVRLRESLDAYQTARVHDVDEKNWLREEYERLRAALEGARLLLGLTPEQFAQAGFPSTSTDE
jgi:hypothetical protein